jgi:hypothetical protein
VRRKATYSGEAPPLPTIPFDGAARDRYTVCSDSCVTLDLTMDAAQEEFSETFPD